MKKTYSILTRGVAGLTVSLLMLACAKKDRGAAVSGDLQARIDSIENLRSEQLRNLDSCIMRADIAMGSYGKYADNMVTEYQKMIDSKYLLSRYIIPGELDHIIDTADNWLPDSARKTDEYKKLHIDKATLVDLYTLFEKFADRADIDACNKELMGVLEYVRKKDGSGYDLRFSDDMLARQFQRQKADYVNMEMYHNSRRQISDAVRAIADTAAVVHGRVADYDAQLKILRARAAGRQK